MYRGHRRAGGARAELDFGGEFANPQRVVASRCLPVAIGDETIPRVVEQRLQHPVPGLGTRTIGDDEGFIDQSVEQGLDVVGRDTSGVTHASGGPERRSVGKDRQPLEDDPFLLVEQVVAPVSNGPEVAVMGAGVP